MEKAQLFAQNVSTLMKAKQLATGENMRQFAGRIGVPYGWLRRISTAGIQQESSRTRSNLKKLADELGFTDPQRMWEEVPERPDVDEIVAMLKDRHLAVWCLLVDGNREEHCFNLGTDRRDGTDWRLQGAAL